MQHCEQAAQPRHVGTASLLLLAGLDTDSLPGLGVYLGCSKRWHPTCQLMQGVPCACKADAFPKEADPSALLLPRTAAHLERPAPRSRLLTGAAGSTNDVAYMEGMLL
jgi:hypothetical protein